MDSMPFTRQKNSAQVVFFNLITNQPPELMEQKMKWEEGGEN